MVGQVEPPVSKSRGRVICRIWELYLWQGIMMVFDNTCPRNRGPTTPVKRGRGRNSKPHSDVSVESPYFSPSKERPPRSKDENFLINERRLRSTTTSSTTKTDQTDTNRSLDSPQNYVSESDDLFEARQSRIPVSPSSVAGLYRQLALCKPYLIQGVLFFP